MTTASCECANKENYQEKMIDDAMDYMDSLSDEELEKELRNFGVKVSKKPVKIRKNQRLD